MSRSKKALTKKKTAKKKSAKKKAGKALATKKTGTALASAAEVQERMAAIAAAQAGTETTSGGNYIKIKDSGFELGGEKMDNPFEACVLDYRFENAYRPGKYVEGEAQPPACFAIGKIEADLAPHPSSPDMQVKPGQKCSACWADEWGSDPDGGKGKACKNRRRIAVLPVPAEGDLAELEPAMMGISPTSLTNWKTFFNKVTDAMGKPTFGVICEIEREDKVTDFTYVDDLEGDDLAACLMHFDAVQSELDAPFDVTGYDANKSGKGKRIPVSKKKTAKKRTAKKKNRRAA